MERPRLMAPAGARPPTPPKDAAKPSAPARRSLRIRGVSRGRSLAVLAVVVAFVLGLLIAPKGHSGLVLDTDRGDNLWALIPTGWKDANLVGPYGSELDGWFDVGDPRESETVLARRPAGGSPRQLADQRAASLGHITGYLQSYLGPVTFAGGRSAWVLQYSLGGTYTAVFYFDACSPTTAVAVTVDAPTTAILSSEENVLPEGAEPVCDGPAFTSPDRGDLAIPLHLPSP